MKVAEQIYKMLIQNTGVNLCDSGGYPEYDENDKYLRSSQGYGRHWERNRNKTLKDFEDEKEVTFEYGWGYTISTFHYLKNQLELDDLCEEFNKLECKSFDSINGYGISKEQEQWLNEKGFKVTNVCYNSYNVDSNLTQVVQTTKVESIDGDTCYLLVQVHTGCDVRNGYSNAHLFIPKSIYYLGYCGLINENVTGIMYRNNMTIPISNIYDSYNLRIDGEIEIIDDKSQLKLFDNDCLNKLISFSLEIDSIIDFLEEDVVELELLNY